MIDPKYFWFNVICLGLGTVSIRGSIVAISSKIHISNRWREIFSYIPAAILPAFVAPAVFFHRGSVEVLWGEERFLVLMLATFVSYFTRSTLLTISFGLGFLYLVHFLH